MIQLGEKVKDSITGIKGVATSRTVYLNGCVRVCVEGVLKGELKEWYFDEQRLDSTSPAKTGGPGAVPPPMSVPPRR